MQNNFIVHTLVKTMFTVQPSQRPSLQWNPSGKTMFTVEPLMKYHVYSETALERPCLQWNPS